MYPKITYHIYKHNQKDHGFHAKINTCGWILFFMAIMLTLELGNPVKLLAMEPLLKALWHCTAQSLCVVIRFFCVVKILISTIQNRYQNSK